MVRFWRLFNYIKMLNIGSFRPTSFIFKLLSHRNSQVYKIFAVSGGGGAWFLYFVNNSLMKYHLHIIKSTFLKHTIQWVLLYSESTITYYYIISEHGHRPQKRPYIISSYSPVAPPHPELTCLDISDKWNHVIGSLL